MSTPTSSHPLRAAATKKGRPSRQAYEFGEGFNQLASANRRLRLLAFCFTLVLLGVLALLVLEIRGLFH
ncbi:MAG: hypothetical protein U0361_19440 [Nitrospiraceae bacterium]